MQYSAVQCHLVQCSALEFLLNRAVQCIFPTVEEVDFLRLTDQGTHGRLKMSLHCNLLYFT